MTRFAIVSDCHCTSDGSDPRPNERLAAVVERVRGRSDEFEFVVFTGDLIGDHRPESYQVFLDIIRPLPMPRYFLVGNHDERGPFREHLLQGEAAPGLKFGMDSVRDDSTHSDADKMSSDTDSETAPICYEFLPAGDTLRCLAFDSLVPGEIHGKITEDQIRWASECVRRDRKTPTLAFVHHPLASTHIDWMEEYPTSGGRELLKALSRANLLAVFFGHVHMPMSFVAEGVTCLSTPATTRQFTDGFEREITSWSDPVYRVVDFVDGVLSSYVDFAQVSA